MTSYGVGSLTSSIRNMPCVPQPWQVTERAARPPENCSRTSQ